MAKNKKNNIKTAKQPVFMTLIQNHDEDYTPSDAQKEKDYQNLRKRASTKSGHAYVDLEEKPVLLRLYLNGTQFNSTVPFLVEYDSFEPIMSKVDDSVEIGFTVNLKSLLTPGKTHTLRVLRKKYKATLHITL